MPRELCGEPANGGPCTMPKGHYASYHRHRVYKKVTWVIKTTMGKELEKGHARVPLNYAIASHMENHSNLVIYLTRWDDGRDASDEDG